MNRLCRWKFCLIGSLATTTIAFGSSPATAQVIQLPSVGGFGYSGSILAPDRGSMLLGGNTRGFTTSGSSAAPRARVLSRSGAATALMVDPRIIDLAELDARILSGNVGDRSRSASRPAIQSSTAPVAAIHTVPAEGEEPVVQVRRLRRLGSFSGDYLRVLSHPSVQRSAVATITPRASQSPSTETAPNTADPAAAKTPSAR